MRRRITVVMALALALGLASPVVAGDEEAVKAVADGWIEAWNAGDMEALGALYAEDADYTSFFGETLEGRAAIQGAFTEMGTTVYKGSKLSIEIFSVSFPKPDVAVMDNKWKLTNVPEGGPDLPTEGQATVVVAKTGDAWKIASHLNRIPQNPMAP